MRATRRQPRRGQQRPGCPGDATSTSSNTIDRVTEQTSAAASTPQPDHYRLAKSVVPRRYDVELTPDLAAAAFTGTVSIAVDVDEPAPRITLNAIELDILSLHGRRCAGNLDVGARDRTNGHRPGTRRRPRGRDDRHRVRRHPQRQAARLLPQHVRRRRRQRARHRHDADAGDRLPAGVPVLGRAGVQGRVRDHVGHRPGTDGGVEQPRDRPRPPPRRQGRDPASATRW